MAVGASHLCGQRSAVKYCHEIIPGAKVGCMISYQMPVPYSCSPDDVLAAAETQRLTLLFSDIQARGYYPSYMARMFEEKGVKLQVEEGDEEILRQHPVDYVSFSYYMSSAIRAQVPEEAMSEICWVSMQLRILTWRPATGDGRLIPRGCVLR